jgi:hypothetical protein
VVLGLGFVTQFAKGPPFWHLRNPSLGRSMKRSPTQGVEMRIAAVSAVAAGLFLFAGPTFAEPSATASSASATSTAAPASADGDEIVCQTGPAPTGTRLGSSRECHTKREWDRMRNEAQNRLTQQQIQITTTVHGN